MYAHCLKRLIDFLLSLLGIILLFPILLLLAIVGAIKLKGNPFFTQDRPGKNEKIFKLIKFRTMTNEKDGNGELLPDGDRLIPYGKFLRATSLDELPEMFNVLKGDMAIIGPRPLLVRYLPVYTEIERHRHDVRPGLTGLAQINGRNLIKWNQRLAYDVEYVNNISFVGDLKILFKTILKVFIHENVVVNTDEVEVYMDVERGVKQ